VSHLVIEYEPSREVDASVDGLHLKEGVEEEEERRDGQVDPKRDRQIHEIHGTPCCHVDACGSSAHWPPFSFSPPLLLPSSPSFLASPPLLFPFSSPSPPLLLLPYFSYLSWCVSWFSFALACLTRPPLSMPCFCTTPLSASWPDVKVGYTLGMLPWAQWHILPQPTGSACLRFQMPHRHSLTCALPPSHPLCVFPLPVLPLPVLPLPVLPLPVLPSPVYPSLFTPPCFTPPCFTSLLPLLLPLPVLPLPVSPLPVLPLPVLPLCC